MQAAADDAAAAATARAAAAAAARSQLGAEKTTHEATVTALRLQVTPYKFSPILPWNTDQILHCCRNVIAINAIIATAIMYSTNLGMVAKGGGKSENVLASRSKRAVGGCVCAQGPSSKTQCTTFPLQVAAQEVQRKKTISKNKMTET